MQGDDITVCSLNVRGLSNNQKRRETFLWLKKKRISLSISYKTCIAQEKQKSVGNPNGGTQLFSQIFLLHSSCWHTLNNSFYFQILKYFVDPEGRFIIADIKIQDKMLTLVTSMRLTRMNLLSFKMFLKNCPLLTVILLFLVAILI